MKKMYKNKYYYVSNMWEGKKVFLKRLNLVYFSNIFVENYFLSECRSTFTGFFRVQFDHHLL